MFADSQWMQLPLCVILLGFMVVVRRRGQEVRELWVSSGIEIGGIEVVFVGQGLYNIFQARTRILRLLLRLHLEKAVVWGML
jgi:hypothetical protein